MRTVDEARAVPGPELPVYQATVLAEPLTSVVADPSGELPTRSGCVADTVPVNPSAAKAAAFELVTDRPAASSACSVVAPAATADAATSAVLASVLIELLRAALRLPAVNVDVAPMVKLPVGGGVVFVAVS